MAWDTVHEDDGHLATQRRRETGMEITHTVGREKSTGKDCTTLLSASASALLPCVLSCFTLQILEWHKLREHRGEKP